MLYMEIMIADLSVMEHCRCYVTVLLTVTCMTGWQTSQYLNDCLFWVGSHRRREMVERDDGRAQPVGCRSCLCEGQAIVVTPHTVILSSLPLH